MRANSLPEPNPKERFAFGENWQAFLTSVDEARIASAETSILSLLPGHSLQGKRFLDIGCGSGLFSLAARRLGAEVWSFDFDAQSVACAHELRRRWCGDDPGWTIQQGSALDEGFLQSLGEFDVVYAWGVLHHTGHMHRAINLAARCVADGGFLFIAIYNDQGGASRRWLRIKRLYHHLPTPLRPVLVAIVAGFYEGKFALVRLVKAQNPLPFADWRRKAVERGMSAWRDWVDWCGGLPFEVAKPEEVIVPLRRQGLILENLTTCGSGWGCNQYVFRRLMLDTPDPGNRRSVSKHVL